MPSFLFHIGFVVSGDSFPCTTHTALTEPCPQTSFFTANNKYLRKQRKGSMCLAHGFPGTWFYRLQSIVLLPLILVRYGSHSQWCQKRVAGEATYYFMAEGKQIGVGSSLHPQTLPKSPISCIQTSPLRIPCTAHNSAKCYY